MNSTDRMNRTGKINSIDRINSTGQDLQDGCGTPGPLRGGRIGNYVPDVLFGHISTITMYIFLSVRLEKERMNTRSTFNFLRHYGTRTFSGDWTLASIRRKSGCIENARTVQMISHGARQISKRSILELRSIKGIIQSSSHHLVRHGTFSSSQRGLSQKVSPVMRSNQYGTPSSVSNSSTTCPFEREVSMRRVRA